MINSLDPGRSFLRKRFTLMSTLEAFLDPLVSVLMLGLALAAAGRVLTPSWLVLAMLAFSLSFPGNVGFHERTRRMVRKVVTNWLVCVAILGGFGFVSGYVHLFQPAVLALWAVCTPAAQIGVHLLLRRWLPVLIRLGLRRERIVIVGVNGLGMQLHRQFADNRFLHTEVMGFFDDRGAPRSAEPGQAQVLGPMTAMPAYVKQHAVDAVYLALPMSSQSRILSMLDELKDTTASIYFVPDIFMTDLIQGQMANVGEMPVMAVRDTPFHGASGLVKRISDIVIASIVLVLAAPLMAAIAVAVKSSSRGPVIFKQRRYGLDGKEILVYKFRSMTTVDDGDEVRQAVRGDMRITKVGAFLRKTSLDEIPQFVNVLQGRMSIVGPRPHAVAHNETYRKLVKGYMLRHKVRPGITGWAQVSGYRGETESVDKMAMRIQYDLEYLRNWSLGFDLWIMLKTALVVVNDKQAY